MSYPKANAVAKHDILCPTSIIEIVHQPPNNTNNDTLKTIDELTSSIVQSAIPQPKLPPDVIKLSTIYTYPDAPTNPKPLSRAPRVWRLAQRSLFDQATTTIDNNAHLLQRCTIAVKLPTIISQDDTKSQKNTKSFHNFIQYLYTSQQVAVLACDSAGRIGFIVPTTTSRNNTDIKNDDESYYSAYLYYAPMKEFIPWARDNYTTNSAAKEQQQNNEMDDEQYPTTWAPQYTPPHEDECKPRGWDDIGANNNIGDGEPDTWTPQYTPPPEEECGPRGWDEYNKDEDDAAGLFVPPGANNNDEEDDDGTAGLFVPPGASSSNDDGTAGLFVPPGIENDNGWDTGTNDNGGWDTTWGNTNDNNDNATTTTETGIGGWTSVEPTVNMNGEGSFHANSGAAAADAFYSNLTRTLETRADSRLYHMRAFNGWVKATQIAELDPDTSRASSSDGKKRSRISPLRVLDLACGKGGDLGKWTIHQRKIENYVGVDVARGSLVDAAIRARQMSQRSKSNALKRCTFTLADLGEDVPGRKRSKKAVRMQKLLTWNLQSETSEEKNYDPIFVAKEGGGIAETDKFDVVSIQFAIHYMMSTRKRARRFFHTVSSLLELGGNLIATTIDARVVVEKLMGLGLDFHFDDIDAHSEVDKPENEERHHNGNLQRKVNDDEGATVTVGQGVCRLKFDTETLRKVFQPSKSPEDMFGLQYTFTLVEGTDHAAGVGEAVDLPEWLTPIPALDELAEESGLKLEYATNFHKFYEERKIPSKNPQAHNALYNMIVLNRNGSISDQEWDVSRMYLALKFRKVRESTIDLGDDAVGEEEMRE